MLSDRLSPPVGPYTFGKIIDMPHGQMAILAGQIGLDPKTGNLVEGGVTQQAE